ncbi:MAG TPA: sigma-54-dependent Fis family transcriptional regulator [Candidatus Dormibacteraeota bacterium]|nr:sigma-54-dependent Fis family transcriptional regulator [Candidatus Dormibacteraeota bacterium]
MSQSSDPLHEKDPAVPDLPELDPLERLSRGLTQWERELLAQPRSPARPRASTDLERVNNVFQASRQVSGTLDLNELLVRIVDSVVQIAGSDRGFLMLMREDGKLHFEIARSRDQSTLPPEEFQISWSVAEEAAHRRETVWVPDAVGSSLFQDRNSVRKLSLRTVVALPILNAGRVLGVLYVDSHSIAHEFTPEDIAILEGFAAQVAVALENARLHEQLKDSKNRLEIENLNLRRALKEETRYGLLVGRSPKMLRVIELLERVIPSQVSVLIQGETGTGKELIARAIHSNGPRHDNNFIAVNCGALPENLLESELFGYRKGAFTGAAEDRVGLFEAADGGTLFLDEVGEMPGTLQVKLLRVLQDSQIRRVGDTVSRRVDFRLVTATNRDLRGEVDAGRFRQDLFYRLNVVPITLPPLRERGEDVLLLASHFLELFAKQQTKEIRGLTSESRELLLRHPWLGNVRELENAMARAVALSDSGAMIEPALFGLGPPVTRRWDGQHTLRETLDAVEAETIREALRQCDSNVSRAARALGVSRQHLHNRMNAHGIRRSRILSESAG